MSATTLPAALSEVIDPATHICPDCGDFIAWCPIWVARWPELVNQRD